MDNNNRKNNTINDFIQLCEFACNYFSSDENIEKDNAYLSELIENVNNLKELIGQKEESSRQNTKL